MRTGPDFIIIGGMKCATSTLHDQLAHHDGIFMTTPKEPNFFSNDEVFARGASWYASLFAEANEGDLCGESSTHYTKFPTYPETLERMRANAPDARLIYVMRDPIARLLSQYAHEWSQRLVSGPIDEALQQMPEIIEYSRYATQVEPYLRSYGPERVLPVFQERLRAAPQEEIERIARFLGYSGAARWDESLPSKNRSSLRLRKSPLRDLLLNTPGLRALRRHLVPQQLRDRLKRRWQLPAPPALDEDTRTAVVRRLEPDVARLGEWLDTSLSCATFRNAVTAHPLEWGPRAPRPE